MSAIQHIQIREPATANLLVDSIDRTSGSSANFTINLGQSIMNGFFHRIAVQEVIMDWCVDNISQTAGNNQFSVQVVAIGSPTYTVTLDDGQYTVKQALDALAVALNAAGTGLTWSIADVGSNKGLASTGSFRVIEGALQTQLNMKFGVPTATNGAIEVNCPKLLPYTYVDITSPLLTVNQKVKDATTNNVVRDTLYRWYFAWDGPAPTDAYGYPIYQGYQRFISRRLIPYPKKIRWESNMPIGQLQFQLYSSQGTLLTPAETSNGELEWAMTLLVSED